MWTPVVKGAFTNPDDGKKYDLKIIAKADDLTYYLNLGEDGTATNVPVGRVGYVYNNIVIPQDDLPILNAEMAAIPVTVKFRRIAIYYSQIASFQAKLEYGFDMNDQLAKQAVGVLNYEIDTEIVNLLDTTAGVEDADLVFNKALPVGVSMKDHFQAFLQTIEAARTKVYNKTRRFVPNYMVCARDVIQVLAFVEGWKPSSNAKINGPYFAGTVNGLKVYVHPEMAAGRFVIGVNGDDFVTSVAVFCPFMPIVPTQLLGFADGGMSQGFSTGYGLEVLNKDLIIAGKIENDPTKVVVNTHAA